MSVNYRAKRLESLRNLLKEQNLDGFFIYGRVNTQYFTGFTGSDSFSLIVTDKESEQYIFLDSRYTEQGKIQCQDFIREDFKEGILADCIEKIRSLNLKRVAVEADYLTLNYLEILKTRLPEVEFVALGQDLARLRFVKDEQELQALRKAIKIADDAFALLLPEIKVGMKESEIAARLEYHMRALGASGTSFNTICASGWRGALPHGVASEKVVEAGEAITLDFGCLYQGYCSDITRTIFLGEPNPEILKIYNVVLEAQLAAEDYIKAGVIGADAHKVAADIISKHGYGQYFGHGLGHSLGLEIHELPSASPRGLEPLPAGSLITVEPGIYVAGLGGVRIEDTCLVTEDGLEILTQADKSVIILPVA